MPLIKKTLQNARQHIGLAIKINLTTALAWLTILYSLKYIDPAVALAISFGILPISTMLISFRHKGLARPTKVDVFFSLVLMILIVTSHNNLEKPSQPILREMVSNS